MAEARKEVSCRRGAKDNEFPLWPSSPTSLIRLGEKAGLRQETISLIETGNPATRIDTMLAVLAALDLEFRIGPRGKGGAADIEEIF